ncbi:hemerythrin domain-containing protein, partial [Mesorhizobium sp. M7A.F.Ca.US.001.02.1.1]
SEDRQRFAADAYADENSRLIAMLTRHLADEEDLIVPLILDRGDRALGVD